MHPSQKWRENPDGNSSDMTIFFTQWFDVLGDTHEEIQKKAEEEAERFMKGTIYHLTVDAHEIIPDMGEARPWMYRAECRVEALERLGHGKKT